jgi:hypothetical protein
MMDVKLTVWSRSPEIKLVSDMKKKPHLGHRILGELGRKASKKKAMIEGIMQIIMMMNRRFGLLSMRNPSAARLSISRVFHFRKGLLTDEQYESECIFGNSPFKESVERAEAEGL